MYLSTLGKENYWPRLNTKVKRTENVMLVTELYNAYLKSILFTGSYVSVSHVRSGRIHPLPFLDYKCFLVLSIRDFGAYLRPLAFEPGVSENPLLRDTGKVQHPGYRNLPYPGSPK